MKSTTVDESSVVNVSSTPVVAPDMYDAQATLLLPTCWTVEQWNYFSSRNDWLSLHGDRLGCSICRSVGSLGPNRSLVGMKIHLSPEWCNGEVAPYGNDKTAQQTSLRKKIHDHKTSSGHIRAHEIFNEQKSNKLRNVVVNQQAEHNTATCAVFRTAYYIAKQDRPFTDHPDLIDLQKMNGVNVGRVLHSNVVCADIIQHIASDMRRSLTEEIIQNKPPIAILIDESTSLGKVSFLIVYIRATFDTAVGPVTFFFDIVSLTDATADGIVTAVLECLHKHRLSDDILAQTFLAFGTDGASVMLGANGGVVRKLQDKFPRLIGWHCFNHRLELSVHDAVKSCCEVDHFKLFFDSLYALYSQSPKAQRELTECATEVNSEVLRIGRILDVRWVASSCRTILAVWKSYAALHAHFVKRAADMHCDARERAKFAGFQKKFENPVFIKNLAIMLDALQELSELSLALQKADITLPVAQRLLTRQLEVFSARKTDGGDHYSYACGAVQNRLFFGVAVAESGGRNPEINRAQFYQALCDSIKARLLPAKELEISNAVAILNSANWPTNLSPEFGEKEVNYLCAKFGLSFSDLKNDFRDYKDDGGEQRAVKNNLRQLFNCTATVPISTAACERGFSKMNLVCNSLRSQLSPENLAALMFVSLNGPPLQSWNPQPYVSTWLASNRRDATCIACPKRDIKVEHTHTAAVQSLWKFT